MNHRGLLLLLLAACSGGAPRTPSADMARASAGGTTPNDGGPDGGAPPDLTGMTGGVSPFAGLQSAKASPSAVQLSWFKVSDAETTTERMGYLVYQATTSGGQDLSRPTYTTVLGTSNYTVPKLQRSTTYYFIVRSRNASGKIDQNRVELSATTPDEEDVQAPAFTGAEMAVPVLSSGVQLSWTAAVDDFARQGELTYLIYRADTSGGQDLLTPSGQSEPGATSYFMGGLSPSSTYHFIIRARDLAGNIDDNRIEVSATTKEVSFAAEVWPAVLSSCLGGCHAGASPQDSLDLSTPAKSYPELVNVKSVHCDTVSLVEPGAPDMSYLVWKLAGSGSCFVGARMPIGGKPVPAADMLKLQRWITSGAPNN